MNLDKVFANNEKWIASKLEKDPLYFEHLSKGQNPDILYIGCSDSRVTSEELMGVEAGEAFVHRNIANMVVSIDLNMMSVLNYAARHFGLTDWKYLGWLTSTSSLPAAVFSLALFWLSPS